MGSRSRRFRGSRTHGRGRKAGRGAGLHGGRGLAGLHKHRFMHMLKYYPGHFGRRGFKRPLGLRKEKRCINLMELEESLPKLLENGIATKVKDQIHIDLLKIGVDKLLAKGKIRTKMRVKVKEASQKAKAKIESIGGQVLSSSTSEKDVDESNTEDKRSGGMNAGGT